jgi:hypothetical protein
MKKHFGNPKTVIVLYSLLCLLQMYEIILTSLTTHNLTSIVFEALGLIVGGVIVATAVRSIRA